MPSESAAAVSSFRRGDQVRISITPDRQAFLIAVLFLASNYYLWIGMGRIPGAERFQPYTKYLLMVLVLGAIVWGTPHTMIADSKELAAMGGSHHPFLGALGVMSAKNTAVNLMILTTFLSFLLYRRANIRPIVPWARSGDMIFRMARDWVMAQYRQKSLQHITSDSITQDESLAQFLLAATAQ